MKSHPSTRSYRRQLDRKHKERLDAFGSPIELKDKYTPNVINTPFCPQCGKEKLQFETKEQAERYIEFNAERIITFKGKAPIRAYFCSVCRCWHVTSKEERPRREDLRKKREIDKAWDEYTNRTHKRRRKPKHNSVA